MRKLNRETRDFVERMGLTVERLGGTRTSGRLMGRLLVADKPMSLDDLAELLHVSKASVSTNARYLEQLGLAHRVSIPGDRRDYYEISPGSFEQAMAARIQSIAPMVDLAKEGMEAVGRDNSQAWDRLVEMRDLYQFFMDEMKSALARWKRGERTATPANH